MKQTHTQCGLWREEKQYRTRLREERHSGEWRGSGVLSGASSLLHLGRSAQHRDVRDRGKTPKPLLSCLSRPSLDTMRGARALKITNY